MFLTDYYCVFLQTDMFFLHQLSPGILARKVMENKPARQIITNQPLQSNHPNYSRSAGTVINVYQNKSRGVFWRNLSISNCDLTHTVYMSVRLVQVLGVNNPTNETNVLRCSKHPVPTEYGLVGWLVD